MPAKNFSAKTAAPHRVEPLPYALYDSNGTLFELYAGGKHFLRPSITWVRLQPVLERTTELLANTSLAEESLWPTS